MVDAYQFVCEVLEWYGAGRGFDRQVHFTDASELFDYLLNTWENIYLYDMERLYGNTDMDEKEILKILPEERKKEMEAIRNEYIMKYESCQINW